MPRRGWLPRSCDSYERFLGGGVSYVTYSMGCAAHARQVGRFIQVRLLPPCTSTRPDSRRMTYRHR
jgi:hypothetical protein